MVSLRLTEGVAVEMPRQLWWCGRWAEKKWSQPVPHLSVLTGTRVICCLSGHAGRRCLYSYDPYRCKATYTIEKYISVDSRINLGTCRHRNSLCVFTNEGTEAQKQRILPKTMALSSGGTRPQTQVLAPCAGFFPHPDGGSEAREATESCTSSPPGHVGHLVHTRGLPL